MTYCTNDAGLTQTEVEGVGYKWRDLDEMKAELEFDSLKDGVNGVAGTEVFYISNPALGLWALRSKFEEEGESGGAEKKRKVEVGGKQVAVGGSGGVGGSKA